MQSSNNMEKWFLCNRHLKCCTNFTNDLYTNPTRMWKEIKNLPKGHTKQRIPISPELLEITTLNIPTPLKILFQVVALLMIHI